MNTRISRTGYEVEDLVEEICKVMFLSDFVVRSPKYKKQSGKAKEAADFLVPFDNTLLAFQVKSKKEIKSSLEKSEVDFQRINATIEDGIKQLNTIRRALNANLLLELKNAAGIRIPFNKESYSRLIGIVIIDLIGEEGFPYGERTEILNGYLHKFDIPIHIFMRDDFQEISTEIDTLPDFIDYVEKRGALYEKRALTPFTNELDLLGIFKTKPQLIDDCLNGKCDLLVISEGIWESYRKKHKTAIEKRNIDNIPSYIIDDIIIELRSAIGYKPKIKCPSKRNDFEQGSIEQYWQSITELSKLPRVIRRSLGQIFIEKMKKAKKTGHGHSLIKYNEDSAFVILCTGKKRQQRANAIYNLSAAAYCGLNAKKVIGVATEPFDAKARSFDVVLLDGVRFANEEELRVSFNNNFVSASHFKIKEYNFKS
ncbi:MAG: hypothetical protein ABR911_09505 [Syntrophales bacterium]|jgi:hypothetical protein